MRKVSQYISANFVDWPRLQQYMGLLTIASVILGLVVLNLRCRFGHKVPNESAAKAATTDEAETSQNFGASSDEQSVAAGGKKDGPQQILAVLAGCWLVIQTILRFVLLRPFVVMTEVVVVMYVICGIGALHHQQTAAAVKHFTAIIGGISHVNTSTKTLVQEVKFANPSGTTDSCPVIRHWSTNDYKSFSIDKVGTVGWNQMLFLDDSSQVAHVCFTATKSAEASSK